MPNYSASGNAAPAKAPQKAGDAVKFGIDTLHMQTFEPDTTRLMERLLGKGTTRDADTGQLVPPGLPQPGYGLRY